MNETKEMNETEKPNETKGPKEPNSSEEFREIKLSEFYDQKRFAGRLRLMQLFMMPFVYFLMLGFPVPGVVGTYVGLLSNFAVLAFFIFCGFFTLLPDPERRKRKLKRTIRRSGRFFLIVFLGYVAVNVAYLSYFGALGSLFSSGEFLRLRTLFDFLVLNVWPLPIGNIIWVIQSLFFACLFFFLVEKLKLSKIYNSLLVVLLVIMLFSGELAAVVGFPYFGYQYIPGGVVTKTLPFMLIGMLIRKNVDKIELIPRFVFVLTFFGGGLCAIGELLLLKHLGLLVYTGNTIGYAVMAISVCCFFVKKPEGKESFLAKHSRSYSRRLYAFCQPVFMMIWVLCSAFCPELQPTYTRFGSLICFAVCFALAFLFGFTRFNIKVRNPRGNK